MSRGDVIKAVSGNDFWGVPRTAVVVQSDAFAGRDGVTVCPTTTALIDAPLFRIRLASNGTGLRETSDVMIDKVQTIHKDKIGDVVGRVSPADMTQVDRALKRWFDL